MSCVWRMNGHARPVVVVTGQVQNPGNKDNTPSWLLVVEMGVVVGFDQWWLTAVGEAWRGTGVVGAW